MKISLIPLAVGVVAAIGLAGVATPAFATTESPSPQAVQDDTIRIHVWGKDMLMLTGADIPEFKCPTTHKYLISEHLAPRRIAPAGVEIVETLGAGIGVTLGVNPLGSVITREVTLPGHTTPSHLLAGWGSGTAFNYWENDRIDIWANCTNDITKAAIRTSQPMEEVIRD